MTTKLTLSVRKDVIERAKIFSRKRGKSLSKIVEEQLEALAASDARQTSAVKAMSGALKGKINQSADVKAAKGSYLKAKHGL